jgi:hypothetical protein
VHFFSGMIPFFIILYLAAINGHGKDVLFEGQYRKAKAKGECPNTKAAVLIDGKAAGTIFYPCQAEKCDVHSCATRYIHLYAGDKDTLAESLEHVQRASAEILTAIMSSE